MARRPTIAFVARELHPLGQGGIATRVAGICEALRDKADLTVVTSSAHESRYAALEERGELGTLDGIRVAFVEEPEPDAIGSYYTGSHLYSARAYERLRELYPDAGPDLIEFADRFGDGLVTVQARRADDELLRDTKVAVRLHGTTELRAVFDGYLDQGFDARVAFALERHVLEEADQIIAPSPEVLAAYRRFYGDAALAPAVDIQPVVPALAAPDGGQPTASEQMRFLYLGSLARRKGVQDLVRAFTASGRDDWKLTIVGADTATAPLGTSMRDQLVLAAGMHPAIELHEPMAREALAGLIDDHDVVVCPARWDGWPSVALEALARNRPVLATPVGGLTAMLSTAGAGWLTNDTNPEALWEAIERLLDDPTTVSGSIDSGAPRRAYERLDDHDAVRAGYAGLIDSGAEAHAKVLPTTRPLVSVVVPYFRMERYLEDTLRSVVAQDYEPIEVLVVNDGSLRGEDAVLTELAERYPIRILTQENAGLGRARNAGIVQSAGHYVLPLDSDNMLEQAFVSRCVGILEREPTVPFVTSWLQYVDEYGTRFGGLRAGAQPIGNTTSAVLADNVAGDGTALMRRDIFESGFRYSPDLTSYEDWQLYRELHLANLHGRVIPERLIRYRVRRDSMLREVGLRQHGRLYGEMQALLRERRQGDDGEPTRASPRSRPAPPTSASDLERRNEELTRENARIARERLGIADAAAGTLLFKVQTELRDRAESAEKRVVDLEAEVFHLRHVARLLEAPRHQAVERVRERVMSYPTVYDAARRLWTRARRG